MAKAKKIRREIEIGGVKRLGSREYGAGICRKTSFGPCAVKRTAKAQFIQRKHDFQTYAQKWFEYFPSLMWKS